MPINIFTMCAVKVAKCMIAISCAAALLSCHPTFHSTDATAAYALTDSMAATAIAQSLTAIDNNLTVEIDEWLVMPGHDTSSAKTTHTAIAYRHVTAKRNGSMSSATADSSAIFHSGNRSGETSTIEEKQRHSPFGNLPYWLLSAIILTAIVYITTKIISKK